MKELSEIEALIANFRLEEAKEQLGAMLEKEPENAEVRMLLGVCGQMNGDTDCFCRIYRELAPSLVARAEAGEESPVIARWRNYLRVAAYLVALGVITLTGTGLAAPTSGLFETNNASKSAEIKSAEKVLDVGQFKNLSRGIQTIKYKNGVIYSLVVVGKTTVPKALRKNPGRAAQYGGEKAHDNAQLEFTRFLSAKCKWGKTADGETAVREEPASATDAQGSETLAESPSFTETEMTKEQKRQSAHACVSGIQSLWEGMNDSGEYVWVGVWNAKNLIAKFLADEEDTRPMTKYNMGGLLVEPKPATKYGMGGKPLEVIFDDDF